jgi:hypothetical protein
VARFTIHVDAAAWGEADRTSLPSPLRENLDTRGRAALETQLEDRNYPEHIFVDRSGVRSEGAQVIFSLGPWLFGVAIGAAVGYGVTQVFGGTVAVNSLLGALVFGLMPPMLTRWFDISDPLIMNPGHGDSNVPVWRFVLGKIAAWLPARRIKGPR